VLQCLILKLHVDVTFKLFVLFECLEFFSKFTPESFLVVLDLFAVYETCVNNWFLECLFDVLLLAKLLVE